MAASTDSKFKKCKESIRLCCSRLKLKIIACCSKPKTQSCPTNIRTDISVGLSKNILLSEARNSNVVFSPALIKVLLNLIAAGSKGPTLDQLLMFLNSKTSEDLCSFSAELISTIFADGSTEGGPRLLFANGIWVDKSLVLKPSFKEILDNTFKAVSNQVDFQNQAVEVINEVNMWADMQTDGLIKELLPAGSVDNKTRLMLTNALHFKGDWNEKFDTSTSKDYDFYLLNGSSVHVPFMTSKSNQFIQAFEGFKVLGLPYKQGEDSKRQFSMYVFLPDANDGLPAFVGKATSENGFFDRHLPQEKVQVGSFRVPKFKFSFGFEASEVLKGLGLVLPFSNEADLTEMVESSAFVSSMFHKSSIEVNEEGTEAAAASAAVVALKSSNAGFKMDFVADHPFVFLIREDTSGAILFVGQMLNPLPC